MILPDFCGTLEILSVRFCTMIFLGQSGTLEVTDVPVVPFVSVHEPLPSAPRKVEPLISTAQPPILGCYIRHWPTSSCIGLYDLSVYHQMDFLVTQERLSITLSPKSTVEESP